MAEAKKQTIIMTCSIVACVVTLITCGVLIGGMKTEVVHQKEDILTLAEKVESLTADTHTIKEEQSFLKGVVSTQLKTLSEGQSEMKDAIIRVDKRIDEWEAK
jgi:hypothetical protein